jgi:2-keto-4-pentenoate hydratase/2-oxohepta-3-ene-1,7-dioic acid hydratase in catechol pathway
MQEPAHQAVSLGPKFVSRQMLGRSHMQGLVKAIDPLWIKEGDVVEIEIESLGILRNPVIQEV